MSKRKYFGTDGVRGTVGEYPITPDFMLRLGFAVGRKLKEDHPSTPQVCIGKDTRVSGYMIESALEAGFIAAGCDVALTGPLPTPGIAYLTRAMRMDLGVVISASHNPFEDNGVKFFSAAGQKLPDEWELGVEAYLEQPLKSVPSIHLGKAIRIDDAAGRYIEFCKSTFASNLKLKGFRILVDAAHGAAYHTAKSVLHELGAEVVCKACAPDGININHHVGATHPEFLVRAMAEEKCMFGISLDGDADRLIMADADGRVYDGDELLYIMAAAERHANPTKELGVVGTVMTNVAFEAAYKELNIEFVRAGVGDRYVLEELNKRPSESWFLGGEGSGHLIDLRRHTTGDGTVSALAVIQAMLTLGKSLPMLATVAKSPQVMVNVRIEKGQHWNTFALENGTMSVMDEFNTTWGAGKGRVLIRASGTEPVVRVMVECPSKKLATDAAEYLAKIIKEKK